MVARHPFLRALLELGLVFAVPLLLLIIRYFSWGAGQLRFVMFGVLFALVAWVSARRGYLESIWQSRGRLWILALCALLLFGMHVRLFARDIARGGDCLTDMGRPSICAGEWLRRGMNPWAECMNMPRGRGDVVDTWSWCLTGGNCIDYKGGGTYRNWTHHGRFFDFMDGYKYGPVLALTYLPFVHTLRERGLFSVNFAFWLAQCALLWLLAREAFPRERGATWRTWLIMLLPLAIPSAMFLPKLKLAAFGGSFELSAPERNTFVLELTQRCSNDIIPVVLVMAATLLAARQRSLGAGVLLGLSLAAKQLPGLLVLLMLPGLRGVRPRQLLIAALGSAALCYLPFFVWAPREMIANLILFSSVRPTNSSSIRAYLPAHLESVVSLAQVLVVVWVVYRFYCRAPRDLPALLRSFALASIGFVALNKVVHGNYLLWLQPWLALVLGGMPYRAERELQVADLP